MNTETIKEIINIFEDSKLTKMELEADDMKIKMEKAGSGEIVYSAPAPTLTAPSKQQDCEEPKKDVKSGYWVKAPIVGTFYSARAIGSTPFVEIGQHVKKGDVLCIIEAMKVMNEIHSPIDGVIAEILITNESMVEFDQDLIRIGETA